MKILYHHRTLSKDGQDVHIEEMIAALRRRGHEVVVVGPTSHHNADFGSDGGFLSRLRNILPRAVSEVLELTYSLIAYRRLLRMWQEERPDLLYERCNLHLLAGVWLKRHTKIPYLLEVNSPLRQERSVHGGLALPALAGWAEATAWQEADAVLPVSHVLADQLRASGLRQDRIHVIPNGVDFRRFVPFSDGSAARAELGLQGKLVLGFVGFMRPWHRLDRVLDAMAALPERPNLHFLVIGDGPARPAFEARARALGLGDRITALGLVDRSRISHFMSTFDIAIQPHVVGYASPLKLFEYMALGRAIIAPDQPNIREVLTDDHNALLIPGDDMAMQQAIDRLSGDQDLRWRLGARAVETIRRGRYSWDDNAARVEQIVARLGRAQRQSAAPSVPSGFGAKTSQSSD